MTFTTAVFRTVSRLSQIQPFETRFARICVHYRAGGPLAVMSTQMLTLMRRPGTWPAAKDACSDVTEHHEQGLGLVAFFC